MRKYFVIDWKLGKQNRFDKIRYLIDSPKPPRLTNYGSALAWQNLAEWNENNRILINSQLKTLFNLTPIIKDAGPYFKSLQQKEFMPQQSVFNK
uniref:Uncharacterized protein n=1 Tax=Glossina palpalis gambiensis TaxID=67801 RepID=A0A1B0B2U4_9MUSC